MSEGTHGDLNTVEQVRKACCQFAMLYFNFCKVLVEALGLEAATPIIQQAVFELSLDRTDRLRTLAEAQGLEYSLESFQKLSDLPFIGWSGWEPSMGGVRCPYAETWVPYFERYPWFKKLAPLYCDVIDTTNIENFTRSTSHRITANLLWGDDACLREYFPSERVAEGRLTYGQRKEDKKAIGEK